MNRQPTRGRLSLADLLAENEALRERIRVLESRDQGPFADVRALDEREALLREAEKASQIGSWWWDVVDDRVTWSRQLFHILGYDPDTTEATTEGFFAAVHPDDVDRVREASARGVETGVAEVVEYRVRHADGTVREVTMNGTMVHDADGRLVRMVGVVVDLTEARERSQALTRTARLLTLAQRVAKAGTWWWDMVADNFEWSGEMRQILGVAAETPATFEELVRCVHPDERVGLRENKARAEHGVLSGAEYRVERPDGSIRSVLFEGVVVWDGDRPVGAHGVAADVTEQREMENRLRQTQKMEAIGELSGGIAHDFNNLLTVILSCASMLDEQEPNELTTHIMSAAEQAAELTRRLLAFSRKSVLNPTTLSPNQLLRSVSAMLSRLLDENIVIELRLAPDASAIFADEVELQQVIINLALNARDAMPQGGTLTLESMNIQVSEEDARLHENASPGNHVQLSVRDTGSGIAPELQQRIFEPFFTTKARGRGTGLGLATVLGVVQQSGGWIELASTEGRGSCFSLRFPATGARPRAPLPRRQSHGVHGLETILLVEDEDSTRHATALSLRRGGYHVIQAADAEQAREHWASHLEFDLVIADLGLPGISGQALVDELRQSRPDVPVVLMTGYNFRPLETPRAHFLQKPFTQARLLLEVGRALSAEW